MLIKTWDHLLGRFKDGQADIYFTENYVLPLVSEGVEALCFVHEEGPDLFLCPFLKREIPGTGGELSDLETPYGYGGPLSTTPDAGFIDRARRAMVSELKEGGVIAGFLRFHPLLNNEQILDGLQGISLIPQRQSVVIDLTLSEEEFWMGEIHSKNRNAIRQAQRAGLVFEIDANWDYYPDFCRLYRETMERVGADSFYLFDEKYFSALKKMAPNLFLGVVLKDRECLAAALFMQHGPFGHYHLSASSREHQFMRPNNLLLYEAAHSLKERGARLFHLGGGVDTPGGDALYKFKAHFSNMRKQFYIGKFIIDPVRYHDICKRWEEANPSKVEQYGKYVLKYRF